MPCALYSIALSYRSDTRDRQYALPHAHTGPAPLLRFLLFSMPPLMTAIPMAAELAVYGIVCGIMYRLLPKKIGYIYIDLISAMIFGRLVWGAVRFAMTGFSSTAFPFTAFWAGAVVNALPGIILQLVLIPAVIITLKKAKFIE